MRLLAWLRGLPPAPLSRPSTPPPHEPPGDEAWTPTQVLAPSDEEAFEGCAAWLEPALDDLRANPAQRTPLRVTFVARKLPPDSRYSGKALTALARRAIHKACAAWRWWPAGRVVLTFERTRRRTAAARNPGRGAKTGKRTIVLSDWLLATHDARSVEHAIVHELAHHYREERWPRTRSHPGGRGGRRPTAASRAEAHDARFCTALARLYPPAAHRPEACVAHPYRENAALAEARDRAAGIRYSARRGHVRAILVHGRTRPTLRLTWVEAGREVPVRQPEFDRFVARFAPEELARVRVQYETRIQGAEADLAALPDRLSDLVRHLRFWGWKAAARAHKQLGR